jgi:hypothetical protein
MDGPEQSLFDSLEHTTNILHSVLFSFLVSSSSIILVNVMEQWQEAYGPWIGFLFSGLASGIPIHFTRIQIIKTNFPEIHFNNIRIGLSNSNYP